MIWIEGAILIIMKIYNQLLNDHFQNPRNQAELKDPDFTTKEFIPSCGDRISMQGKISDGVLQAVAFTGAGCIISQAAASLLTEKVLGMTIKDILQLDKNDMLSMLGIQLGPTRLECALLSLHALQEGIRVYQKKAGSSHAQSSEVVSKTQRDT